MADVRYVAAIRRFWDRAKVLEVYEKILNASLARVEDVTVIVSKGNDAEQAGAQVVVRAEDYPAWMDVLEARMVEFEAEDAAAAGEVTGRVPGTAGTDYSFIISEP